MTVDKQPPLPHVAFVDQTGQLGGAELSLLDVIRSYPGKKRAVLFEDGPFAEALRFSQIETHVCPLGKRASAVRKQAGLVSKVSAVGDLLDHRRRLKQLLRGCDVVYTNTAKALVAGALANLGSGRKLIYHLRDMINASHFSSHNRRLLVTLANRCASRVIANSAATADAFVAAGGRQSAVEVVYNGFDLMPFDAARAASDESRITLRRELDTPLDARVVAVVGRLAAWKGQHVAVDALAQMESVHLWIVGDALFGEDDEYRDLLQRLVNEKSLHSRVHFLGQRTDVLDILQAVDVVAHCSTAPEPFGRVLVEGMLSRRPLVASRAGGALEIVSHGETGLLAEPGNADDLAVQIRRLFEESGLAARLVDQAERSAAERFGLPEIATQINQIITTAASG